MTLTWLTEAENDVALHIDRRRDVRQPQERDVRISEPYAGGTFDGTTLDVSTKGMRILLESDCHLRPGRIIHVHVGLNAFGRSLANRRNVIPARVVWVDESINEAGGLIAGVELLVNISASAA